MTWLPDSPGLGLPEPELQRRFSALQQKLVPLWRTIESFEEDTEQTVVVVPSLTVDFSGLEGSLLQAYEERFPFPLAAPPAALFDVVVRHGLHYDQTSQTGVVLHMLSAVGDRRRLGLIAVSDAPEAALALYDAAKSAFDREALVAREHAPLGA